MNHPSQYTTEFLDKIESTILELKAQGHSLNAAFDADGTLWATDLGEYFFNYIIANKLLPLPADPWAHYLNMKKINNDPRPAYLWLAQIAKGVPIATFREWAEKAVVQMNPLPIFAEQKKLIDLLLKHRVEIYIVTASITWAVEPGARRLGIGEKNVLGMQTQVQSGIITDLVGGPLTYKQGKVEALLQKTAGAKPFLASGNTSGDTQLLQSATHFAIAVGSVGPADRIYLAEQELADLAKASGWPYLFFKG